MSKYIIIFFSIYCFSCFSQQQDSILTNNTTKNKIITKKHIYSVARRAAIFSACLPGLGQAYNKKCWKIPIIYLGLSGFGYLFYVNNQNYKEYRQALIQSQDTANKGYTIIDGIEWSTSQLQLQKLQFKKHRDQGIIGMAVIYLLNVIDANVDGHLKTFDVSDDLSLHIDAWQSSYSVANSEYKSAYGLSLKLNFK
jgi:hypothetical protein